MATEINPVRESEQDSNTGTKSRLKTPTLSFGINTVKKRVLFIITQSEMGGAQRFLHTLVTQLDKTKYEMLVAAGSNFSIKHQASSIKYDLLDLLEKEGIETIRLKHWVRDINLWQDFLALLELRRIIKSRQPNTIFLNSSKAGFVGSLATVFPSKLETKNYKLKTVYRIGGWTFNDPWPTWKKLLWIVLEKVSARWKDAIIVNNRHDYDQAQKLKIKPRGKLALVYNELDVYKMDFLEKEEARLKLFEKISRQWGKVFQLKTVIGVISNLYPAKKLDDLVSAAEKFKNQDDVAFFIIGDGPEKAKIEKMIKDKNLEKKVFLLGQIPNASRFLSAFDIFVLPSVKEGFPWSLLEAMAAKLPVIATNVGAVPEIIEDYKNGMLIEPARPEQIAAKIQELLNNDRLKQELGIQAHQTVLFKFTLDKMVKEVESLL